MQSTNLNNLQTIKKSLEHVATHCLFLCIQNRELQTFRVSSSAKKLDRRLPPLAVSPLLDLAPPACSIVSALKSLVLCCQVLQKAVAATDLDNSCLIHGVKFHIVLWTTFILHSVPQIGKVSAYALFCLICCILFFACNAIHRLHDDSSSRFCFSAFKCCWSLSFRIDCVHAFVKEST